MDSVLYLQTGVNVFLQSLGEWLKAPMQLFSFLGQEEFYLLVLPVLYWCVDAGLGLRVGLMLMVSGGFNALFKLAFHMPRPYWINRQVQAWGVESSFGLPSGHAMNAVAVWGTVAAFLRKGWGWVIAIVLMVLIGFSRLVLGVHFWIDVLTGWLAGTILLLMYLWLEKSALPWLREQKASYLILLGGALSMGIMIAGGVILLMNAGWQIPGEWIDNAILASGEAPTPLDSASFISTSGALLGLAVGAVWLREKGWFQAEGTLLEKILRYVIGAVGVFILWYGLGKVFPRTEDVSGIFLRYFRYALVGLWIAYGAPAVFWQLKIARRSLAQPE